MENFHIQHKRDSIQRREQDFNMSFYNVCHYYRKKNVLHHFATRVCNLNITNCVWLQIESITSSRRPSKLLLFAPWISLLYNFFFLLEQSHVSAPYDSRVHFRYTYFYSVLHLVLSSRAILWLEHSNRISLACRHIKSHKKKEFRQKQLLLSFKKFNCIINHVLFLLNSTWRTWSMISPIRFFRKIVVSTSDCIRFC